MSFEDTSRQLKLLQDELACLRAAEDHVEQKIHALLDQLNAELSAEQEKSSDPDSSLSDLPNLLRRFETEHPTLTDSINRVLMTLSNMGI